MNRIRAGVLRRIVAVAATLGLAATMLVGVSQPAQAQAPTVLTNATGCGTNVGSKIGLDSALLGIAGTTRSYDNVRIDCVINAAPIDLFFFVLPFNFVTATSAAVSLEVKSKGFIVTTDFEVRLKFGIVDACLFGTNIQLTGVNPNRAGVQCIGIRSSVGEGAGGLFEFSGPQFDVVSGNPGRVNGLQPFKGFDGILGLLNGIIVPLIQGFVPGPLTSNVSVQAR
jgi:hypothetical protein